MFSTRSLIESLNPRSFDAGWNQQPGNIHLISLKPRGQYYRRSGLIRFILALLSFFASSNAVWWLEKDLVDIIVQFLSSPAFLFLLRPPWPGSQLLFVEFLFQEPGLSLFFRDILYTADHPEYLLFLAKDQETPVGDQCVFPVRPLKTVFFQP